MHAKMKIASKCSAYKVHVQNFLFRSEDRWFFAGVLSMSVLYPLPNPPMYLNSGQLCCFAQFFSKRLKIRELNYQHILYSYNLTISQNQEDFQIKIKNNF